MTGPRKPEFLEGIATGFLNTLPENIPDNELLVLYLKNMVL